MATSSMQQALWQAQEAEQAICTMNTAGRELEGGKALKAHFQWLTSSSETPHPKTSIMFPKQSHQLGTKCSNTGAQWGHFWGCVSWGNIQLGQILWVHSWNQSWICDGETIWLHIHDSRNYSELYLPAKAQEKARGSVWNTLIKDHGIPRYAVDKTCHYFWRKHTMSWMFLCIGFILAYNQGWY